MKPMTEEEKIEYYSADGFRLVGLRAVPPNPRGWVVMTHGITQNKDEFGGYYGDLARALNSIGIGTLRFDFRGHGESSGDSMDISIVGDVLDIHATLRQVEEGPIAIVGTSFGSGPAAFVAEEARASVRCLAFVAPVIDYDRTFLRPETPWAKASFGPAALSALPEKGHLLLDGKHRLSPRLIEEFHLLDPIASLARSRVPTLIVHGDKDSMVPYAASYAAATRLPTVKLVTLPNTDHGFSDIGDEDGLGPASLTMKSRLVAEVVEYVTGSF
jgi:pimeloyl-ACP methyl ester carboxylesterase